MSRRRIALLYIGVAVAVLVATFVVLQRFGVSRAFVEHMLAKVIVRDRFRLGDANLDLGDGKLTLDQLRISARDAPPDRPLVAVDKIELGVDTNPLGSMWIHEARFKGLHLDLDLSQGAAPDLGAILQQSSPDPTGDPAAPPPAIHVENSRVTLRFAPDAAPIEFFDVALRALPEEAGSSRMILSGSMISPSGLPTKISGSGDFATNQFRALFEIEDFPLDPSLASRFAPAIGEILEEADLGGHADRLVLWLEYDEGRLDGGSDLVAGAQLEVSDLRGSPPGIPYSLIGATTRISVTTRNDGSIRFVLDDADSVGDLSARGMLTRCFTDEPTLDAEIVANDILVGPDLRDALCAIPSIKRIWEAFDATTGRVDAIVQLRDDGDLVHPRAELDLFLDGVTCTWNGLPNRDGLQRILFPETIENVRGRIHLRGQELRVDDVEFETCGGIGRVDGSIGVARGEPIVIDVEFDGLDFNDRVRGAVASVVPDATEHWDAYSPEGRAAARVRVAGINGEPAEVRVKIRPLDASASFEGFPYRLADLRGLVEIEPDGVSFDLLGRRDRMHANLHGRFRKGAGEDDPLGSELWINAEGVQVDDDLHAALVHLSPELSRTWEYVRPSGTVDCELTLWREPEADAPSYDIRIDARPADVQLESFALPIRGVEGPIFVLGTGDKTRVDIGVVHGAIENSPGVEPARLTSHGSVHTGPDGPAFDVVSTVSRLELVEPLRDALEESGAFSAATWNVLRPSGFVDVVARQTKEADEEQIAHELSIELDGVGSDAKMLPRPARSIHGEVTVREAEARFASLRGRVGGYEVHLSHGLARHDAGETTVAVTVGCRDFPIGDDLANLFTGPIKQAYLDRDFSGRLAINRLDLRFRFPETADSFVLDFGGRLGVRETRMTMGTEVEDIVGIWRIDSGHVDADGGFVAGTVESGGFTTAGHRVNGARAQFFADSRSLELDELSGRIHNGVLTGLGIGDEPDLVYEFAGKGRLRTRLGWRDVSFSETLRASGVRDSDYRGNLSGELHLEELVGADIVNARGTARVDVTEGRLGQVPVFTAIYSYLAPRRRPTFEAISVDLSIGSQRVEIKNVEIDSPLLSVSGRGRVTMDGYLDMVLDFADLFGSDADWLVLPQIARLLTSGVIRFHVHGYLRDPRATPQWLWESKPSRVDLGPIPARKREW